MRREADLDAEDTFLPMVLGLVSLVRRLDALLPAAPSTGRRHHTEAADDPTSLDLLLGILAVHRHLGALFSAVEDVPAPRAEPRPPTLEPIDLMR